MTLLDFTNKVYAKEKKERKPSVIIIREMLYYAYHPFFLRLNEHYYGGILIKAAVNKMGQNILGIFLSSL